MLMLSKYEGKNKEEIIKDIELSTKKSIDDFYIKETSLEGTIFKSKKYVIEIIEKNKIIEFIKDYINTLDKSFNININTNINEQDGIINIKLTSDNNSILIGKDGKTIDAIQALIRNTINNQTGLCIKVNVDVSNYKQKKDEQFSLEIEKLIKEVLDTKIEIKLDPMNSYQRRIVHNLVAKYDNLKTESIGIEPNRYTIIKYEE